MPTERGTAKNTLRKRFDSSGGGETPETDDTDVSDLDQSTEELSETSVSDEPGNTNVSRETEEPELDSEPRSQYGDNQDGDYETYPSELNVSERPNINVRLPPEIKQEVEAQIIELQAEFKREHGEQLDKNSTLFPALLLSGLESEELRDRLGLN